MTALISKTKIHEAVKFFVGDFLEGKVSCFAP